MARHIETVIEYCELDKAFISSNERRWATQIHKLKEKFPDEVEIIKEPSENDGVICAKFPPEWARIRPTKQIYMDDEERRKRGERLNQSLGRTTNGKD